VLVMLTVSALPRRRMPPPKAGPPLECPFLTIVARAMSTESGPLPKDWANSPHPSKPPLRAIVVPSMLTCKELVSSKSSCMPPVWAAGVGWRAASVGDRGRGEPGRVAGRPR
jgi:hypothetical protein